MALAAVSTVASVGTWQPACAVLGTVLVLLPSMNVPAAFRRIQAWLPRIAAGGLLLVVLAYPSGRDFALTIDHPENLPPLSDMLAGDDSIFVHTVNYPDDLPRLSPLLELDSYLGKDPSIQSVLETALARRRPGTAAALLQDLQASQPPFRYATYFGAGGPDFPVVPSTALRLETSVQAILASARAPRLGLEQISGYNPLHLAYYTEYVAAMNGARQDYHWLDVYATALARPQLVSMLNVRYVLVPTAVAHTAPIASYGRRVYSDNLVVVFENPKAFPRAWLVHDVRPDEDGRALPLLASGAADGHVVAFVEGPMFATGTSRPAARPPSAADDRVVVSRSLPETIAIQSSSVADGLLVVSQPFATGWSAYVDGERVEVVRANHALQGVQLAAGEHTVVLRYEPKGLTLGASVTAGTTLVLASLWCWALGDWLRRDGVGRGRARQGRSQAVAWGGRGRSAVW